MKRYTRPLGTKDLCEAGRLILAHGEVTGHAHEVIVADSDTDRELPAAEFFEEPGSGRRVLFVTRPCVLTHQEHGLIALDPAVPQQYRQGDVLLNPLGLGVWEVIRQREYVAPELNRSVAD